MKNYLYSITITLLFFSCTKENEIKTIKNKDFSLDIPANLSETKDLNDDADLQYNNLFEELYVIVIKEDKKDLIMQLGPDFEFPGNIEGYMELLKTNMGETLKSVDFSKVHTHQINGMKAKTFVFEAKVENNDIYYEFGIFEGKNKYYQVMTWTLLDKKTEHSPKMRKMINSFKELKSRAK
jgi:hypothetical protein